MEQGGQKVGGTSDRSLDRGSCSKQEDKDGKETVKKSVYRPLRRHREPYETPLSVVMKYLLESEKRQEKAVHPIDLFFQSTASTVKKFPPYYQNVCKTKVFSVVSDLEMTHIMEQLPSSAPATPVPEYTTDPNSFHHNEAVTSQLMSSTPFSYNSVGGIDSHYPDI